MRGVPLRIALSGTFTPGIKGGLRIARDMIKVTFMPSAGIEFVTQMVSHSPEYVNSGLEMQTNVFHESGLHAKITRAVMKYNRRRHVITADIQIPDYNVKAGGWVLWMETQRADELTPSLLI
ncbi:apolipoprotein B-100 [Oreochromis niloticus]|uniref:apolipoprotein B-100 n=1 Tax=Oreochromis niloticus TaxID=8128 RepID=UPI00039409CF|nr:apolipoprotein B-100 [Oreochromis niloticus]CAI5683954.1 unnamed protein product [Mustela putorius furo]